jgi:hypothetical protein
MIMSIRFRNLDLLLTLYNDLYCVHELLYWVPAVLVLRGKECVPIDRQYRLIRV